MNFKRFFSNKKRNIALIIVAALLLLDLGFMALSNHFIEKLPDQHAAERWQGDEKCAQISLFFTEDQMITSDDIKKLEYSLEKKMQEAGILQDDDDDNDRIVDTVPVNKNGENAVEDSTLVTEEIKLYDSCYSAQGISTVIYENRKAENIDTIGVGGDFFLFHPLEIISGAYFGADDLMKDRIVVDEDFAWQLFGSNDIIGECVTIGGVNHYICGVVKRAEGRFNVAAGLSKSTVYMSYDSLAKYGTILSGRVSEVEVSEDGQKMQSGGINCYEVVMPDPVDGLALRLVRESSGREEKYISSVDNTKRFDGMSLLSVVLDFGIRSMWTQPIFYPYWENVARGWEDILGRLWLIRMICRVAIFMILAVMIVIAYRNKTWTVRGIAYYLADKKYDFEAKRKLLKQK